MDKNANIHRWHGLQEYKTRRDHYSISKTCLLQKFIKINPWLWSNFANILSNKQTEENQNNFRAGSLKVNTEIMDTTPADSDSVTVKHRELAHTEVRSYR